MATIFGYPATLVLQVGDTRLELEDFLVSEGDTGLQIDFDWIARRIGDEELRELTATHVSYQAPD